MSETQTPLLPREQGDELAERWQEIQASFVDRPQEAVQEADALVSDLMQRITTTFAAERERLERQWGEGDDVSTEGPARGPDELSLLLRPASLDVAAGTMTG